jgi:DNA-binding MarR family transcriptional regulator
LQPQFVELLRMLVERILAEVFPEETGAARLQQVGLFTLIFVLQNDEEPVTASRLATLSGQAHSEVSRQVQKLLKIGLVERAAITSPHGRGRAWHLSVKRGPESQKLLEALFGASGKKSAAKSPSKTSKKTAKARPRTPPR